MSTTSHVEEESKKHPDHEIRNMIITLTNRLTKRHSIGKSSTIAHNKDNDEDGHGLRVVTLVGTNEGATMRYGFDENEAMYEEKDKLGTYVNSNFQAVNNSILLGGSYKAQDPGVQMVIEECGRKKEKKMDKGGSKTEKEWQKKGEGEE